MDPTTERLAAAIAATYSIDRELGAGGMATVYLAEDIKHHRRVAIKVLRPDIAAAVGPGRFEDEIEIAAQLHHPHIVAVYDSGAVDGFLYYVMPQVEGETLRERLQRGDRIPTSDVVRILSEVADALAYAHDHGVVHRDIKPENVMMSGRHALVMDFGIAKAVRDASARRSSTSMGLAIGTPEYMSPEQAAGDPNLDHRTDVYSLGVLGYELLTGKPPFSGGGTEQILMRHITQPPAPIAEVRPDVSPALAAVITRALAKSPGERWQTAEEMRVQLEPLITNTTSGRMAATSVVGAAHRPKPRVMAIAAGAVIAVGALAAWTFWGGDPKTAAPTPTSAAVAAASGSAAAATIPDLSTDPSIAVLPFENMSSDKEQAFFSDGISEELLNLLAKIPELRVTARTSSFQFRDQDIGIQEIARKLNVAAVLEGSVRKSGDKVRITVQLIRAKDGTHLWSETYDRKLDDVFKVQDEIATAVVDKLKLTLLSAAPKARPVDAAVYPMLLQADAMYLQGGKDSRRRATELYQRVTVLQPQEARAWLGLARARMNEVSQGEASNRKEALRLGREAANKALALDPKLGIAHSYLAVAYMMEHDLPNAAREYDLSFQISPNEPRVIANLSRMLSHLGRADEAVRAQQRLVVRDPASAQSQFNLCSYQLGARQLDDAESTCRTGLLLTPDYSYGRAVLAEVLLQRGQFEASLKEARLEQDPGSRLVQMAKALDSLGRRDESEKALQEMIRNHLDGYVFGPVEVYAHRGDADKAFEWLERARLAEDPEIGTAHNHSSLASLHKDPRWLPFLRKIGTAPEQLAKIKFDPKLPG